MAGLFSHDIALNKIKKMNAITIMSLILTLIYK